MLVIRKEQIEAMKEAPLGAFKEQMFYHFREKFPQIYELIGKKQMQEVISLGIKRARAHGFNTKGAVRKYITLMFTLGSYFDEDPLLPWINKILEEGRQSVSIATMRKLYTEAMDYILRITGENNEFYNLAIQRAKETSFEALTEDSSKDLMEQIHSDLSRLYPERYKEITETSITNIIVKGKDSAKKYGLETRAGVRVYLILMFMFGSHFDQDPLHPWAALALDNKNNIEPINKIKILYSASVERLAKNITL